MLNATRVIALLSVVLIAAGTGCAHYEYDIARPPEFAGHIGTKEEFVFQRDPIEYRLKTVENRLVMLIYNNTDDPIRLIGDRSTAVDPKGQSHPVHGLTIAPHSNAKLIFPPLRPVIENRGTTFGIGIGAVVGSDDRRRFRDDWSDPWYDDYEPRYLTVIEDDALYWDWDGEGEMRLALTFQRDEQTFTHEFVVRRVKM